jgi:membrane protease YdiL (CAAX protease family)
VTALGGSPGAEGQDAAAADAPRGAAHWLRVAGALAFWGTAQGVFIAPAPGSPLGPGAGPFRPLLPPLLGALVNLLVAAGFLWWFVLRPAVRRGALGARRRRTFRLRRAPAGAWPLVAAAAAGSAVAANACLLVLPRFVRLPPEQWVVDAYTRLPLGALALFVLAAVVAPLMEEFLFRGWMQGALERRPGLPRPWGPILVTAVVFALAHGPAPFGLVPRLGLAVAAGYAAWATASIWPSVALHAAYNASLFAGAALLPTVLPRPAAGAGIPMEAWADADRAALFFWARDGRVFGPALGAVALGVAVAVWALARLRERGGPAALARDPRVAVPDGG